MRFPPSPHFEVGVSDAWGSDFLAPRGTEPHTYCVRGSSPRGTTSLELSRFLRTFVTRIFPSSCSGEGHGSHLPIREFGQAGCKCAELFYFEFNAGLNSNEFGGLGDVRSFVEADADAHTKKSRILGSRENGLTRLFWWIARLFGCVLPRRGFFTGVGFLNFLGR